MKTYDVVAIGELLIDFTENGYSQQGNPILEANPGGAPCNVLAMLQKFGHKTAFIGKVGNDRFGHMLEESLKKAGIGVEGLVYDLEIPTTLAFVHTAKDGDRSFSFYRNPGADMMLREEEISHRIIKEAKIFHFGTLSMTDEAVEKATKKAISIAKDNNLIISFDPNLRPALWKNMSDAKSKMEYGMSQCDILKISDDEIKFFTGESDLEKGIKIIKEKYNIKLICATFGKNGSAAYYKNTRVYCEPFLQEATIETTGAGDTFMGSILNGVLEYDLNNLTEHKIKEMLTVANAGASLITTKKGALMVMPEMDEINSLRQERGRL